MQLGDQYRLISPQEQADSAVQYVDKARTEAALFVFRTYRPTRPSSRRFTCAAWIPRRVDAVEGYGVRSGGGLDGSLRGLYPWAICRAN